MLYAIGYGFITLITIWMGGGANADVLTSRTPWCALFLLAAMGIFIFKDASARSSKWFSIKAALCNKASYIAPTAVMVGGLIFFVSLKLQNPSYFETQSAALSTLTPITAFCFALCLAASGYLYHRFFNLAWGIKSGAFLEALTWGLTIQSLPIFVWIFVSGWILSRFMNPESAWVAATIRLLVGLAWIALL